MAKRAAVGIEAGKDLNPRSRVLLNLETALDYPNALARVAQYVLENPRKVVRLSLAELSAASESGQATVFRLCRELGYDGFTDFKLALATEIGQREADLAKGDNPAVSALDEAVSLITRSIVNTRDLVEPDVLTSVASHLLEARQINIYGSGESGIAAEILSYRLLPMGVNAHALRDADLACEAASALTQDAAAIAISQSGASPDTVTFAQNAHRAGAFTLAITCHPKALVAKHADFILQMARLHQPALGGGMVGLPRAVFVAEALAIGIAEIKSENEQKI